MSRRLVVPIAAVLLAVLVFVLLLQLPFATGRPARAIDDIGQLLAATTASVATAWRSRHSGLRARRSWLLLSAGTGAWAVGEAIWSYYELIADKQTPFPSLADAGFLLFPAFAVVGLLLWPSVALRGGARWRALLDGTLVAGSLFIISWVSVLGSTVHTSGDTRLGWIVSIAYPVSDLVLITLVLTIVVHASAAARSGLGVLAIALSCLGLADSGFAYLTSRGEYVTGSVVDVGWFGGFLLVAAAACTATRRPGEGLDDVAVQLESTTKALLPYIPVSVGLAVAVGGAIAGSGDELALITATMVMGVLLLRQLLAVLDNRSLVRELVTTQGQLHYQAFHDPLTGLANRALFADRLRHVLELHRRDLRPLSLIYCDLDGLKKINDSLGHDAGDEMIRNAAERLRAVTRTSDTVARMGGDEFAVLVEGGDDPMAMIERILDAFTQPASISGQSIALTTSMGVAELTPESPPVSAAEIIQRADAAMYHAKRNGKGCAVIWTDQAHTITPIAR